MKTNKDIIEEIHISGKAVYDEVAILAKRIESVDQQLKGINDQIENMAIVLDNHTFEIFLKGKKGRRKYWTNKEDLEVKKGMAKGKSYEDIAKILDRTPNAVQTRWHKYIKPRKSE